MASRTELFLDDEFIEVTPGVTRRINRPRKHRLNPVMRPEAWWESTLVAPNATLYDSEDKLFRMWYRTGSGRPGETVAGQAAYSAYATSSDGVRWERPVLGLVDFDGRRDHNIVMTGGAAPGLSSKGNKGFILSVIPHPNPRDGSERYVCLFADMAKRGAYLGYSGDGIHWRREQEPFWRTPVDATNWGDDTVKSMIYDKLKGRWVVYRRIIPEESGRMVAKPGDEEWELVDRYLRVIGYAESQDLREWGNYRMILAPDGDDPADTEFYGLSCYNYEGVYVGYLWVYHAAPDAQSIDVQLVSSRDGISFSRACRREAFLPSGAAGYFDYEISMGYQAEPIVLDDTIYLFYEACNYAHTQADSRRPHSLTSVGLATLKRDRFVSLETDYAGPCRLVTKPFAVEYPKLFLNAGTWGDGAIRVEVLTPEWMPIPGFTERDAIVVRGDALAHAVRWAGNSDLSRLHGKEVRLKLYMVDARIHAVSFDEQDRPAGTVVDSLASAEEPRDVPTEV